jgi:hypothetical protein
MKYFFTVIFLLLISVKYSFAQCPVNIDFEQGTFNNWQCFTGSVDTLNLANVITLNPSVPTFGRHEIMDSATAGLDAYGNFLRACPYGNRYSVKPECYACAYNRHRPGAGTIYSLPGSPPVQKHED